MSDLNYWKECLASSFDEHGLVVTDGQLQAIADDMKNGHENYSLGYPTPESPMPGQIKDLQKALEKEKSLRFCIKCLGTGRLRENGPSHGYEGPCWKCNGNGKHL